MRIGAGVDEWMLWWTRRMGRQIAIITEWRDELSILNKVAQLADSDIRVFSDGFAESPETLWIQDWEKTPIREVSYGIWPTTFRWEPQYRQITPPCAAKVKGKWVVANKNVAPVIEVLRPLHGAGRVYWGKYFSATEPLSYDVAVFDRLVSALWRWIRKIGNATGPDAHRTFVMPRAHEHEIEGG